jgi:hypothetical protein
MPKKTQTKIEPLKTYIRYELHSQMENGNWCRVTAVRGDDQTAACAELLRRYREIHKYDDSLRWLIPAELLRRGKLRFAKCTVEVLGELPERLVKEDPEA